MLVVSDTSPLTNLAAIGRFDLLRQLFGRLHIADAVARELNAGGIPHPGSREVDAAEWIEVHPVSSSPLIQLLTRDLDSGEAATLALSLDLGADLVLLDEREGRQAALRLRPFGVLGLLLQAKKTGLLSHVQPALDELRREAGFYLSDRLYRHALLAADE